jgi:hypothetical protein
MWFGRPEGCSGWHVDGQFSKIEKVPTTYRGGIKPPSQMQPHDSSGGELDFLSGQVG